VRCLQAEGEFTRLAHSLAHPAQPPGSFHGAVDARVSRYIDGGRSLSVGRLPSRVRHVATPNTVASQVFRPWEEHRVPSPSSVITGRRLRQRLYRTRLHRRLGHIGNKNRHCQSLSRISVRKSAVARADGSLPVWSRGCRRKGKRKTSNIGNFPRVPYGAAGKRRGWWL